MDDERRRSACLLPSFFGEGTAWLSPEFLAFPTGDAEQFRVLEDLLQERSSLNLARLPRKLASVEDLSFLSGQTDAIVARLGKLDGPRRRALLGAPQFTAWLDAALNLSRRLEDTSSRAELRLHLARFPLLVLPWLARIGAPEDQSYAIALTDDGRSGPLDVRWGLSCHAGARFGTLRLASDRAEIALDDRLVATLNVEAFQTGAGSAGVRVLDAELIRVREREFAAGGRIEIGVIEDFPALAAEVSEWPESGDPDDARTAVEGGLDVLAQLWPEAHREVQFLCRLVAPVNCSRSRCSATHGSYMFVQMLTSNRGDALKHAEVMLHEATHCKLFGICELTMLLGNDGPVRYRHPWRPDLRPLRGVLAGTHAFLAVLGLYRRAEHFRDVWPEASDAALIASRLADEVGRALDVLQDEAEFTPNGRMMMDSMVESYEQTMNYSRV
jgi:HEXXH motif-containing protein